MPAAKTLYLANPYGFSAQQNAGPLQALVAALEALGAEVWEPFARNNQIDKAAAGWAWQIGQADLRDVRDADGIFAVVNGCPPDEGVMVELGMAIAWEKPVYLFRDDFSALHRQRGLSAQPDDLHRPAGGGLGGLLVRLGRRDRRSRQGARALAEGARRAGLSEQAGNQRGVGYWEGRAVRPGRRDRAARRMARSQASGASARRLRDMKKNYRAPLPDYSTRSQVCVLQRNHTQPLTLSVLVSTSSISAS